MVTKDSATNNPGTAVGIVATPETQLAYAQQAAQALMSVVSTKKKPVIMNGEQYLEYEDWLTVGQFYGSSVRTLDAVPIEIDGVKGAKARAELIDMKTGQILSTAEAYCMRDEPKWNTRPVYEWQGEGKERKRVKVGEETVPWFQLASMAQTRAGAKACRNRLAWVVVLAGYRPTPAEEMTGNEEQKSQTQAAVIEGESAHWCAVHKCAFRRNENAKGVWYSHKNPDESWCNETKKQAPKAPVENFVEGEVVEQAPAEAKAEPEGIAQLRGKLIYLLNTSWPVQGVTATVAARNHGARDRFLNDTVPGIAVSDLTEAGLHTAIAALEALAKSTEAQGKRG